MTGHAITVTEVRAVPAGPGEVDAGLVAFVSAVVNGLRVDGIALRLTRDGRHALSWPARRDGAGVHHPVVLPVGARTRRRVEREILRCLGVAG